MKAKLTINDVEIMLGHKTLGEITYCLDDKPEHSDLFRELAKSECNDVLTSLVGKEHLSRPTLRVLIENNSLEVMRDVVDSRRARRFMTRRDLETYIDSGDYEILTSLITNLDDFTERYEICETDWLCKKLIKHPDPAVRYALAENSDTPEDFLERLAKDRDIDVARQARETLSEIRDEDDEDDDEFEDDDDEDDDQLVMTNEKQLNKRVCSFCDKNEKEVLTLIAGPGVYICDECAEICNEIVQEKKTGGRR